MLTELPVWAVRLITALAALPVVVYLAHRFATWCANELRSGWQPPTWRDAWAWICRQRIVIRSHGRSRQRNFSAPAATGVQRDRVLRWPSKGDRA